MKINKFNYYILYTLLIILFTAPVRAQDKQFVQVDKNLIGSNVYVLSNRETVFQNNTKTTLNSVKKTNGLNFIRANSYSKDSLQIERIDSIDFLSEISLLEGNWVVFVHGDAKTLEKSIYRGLKIQHLYNVNVLIYSWPSSDPNLNGAKNFKRSQFHVSESLNNFVEVLKFAQLFREVNPSFLKKKMSLFFHSLGGLYLEKMVKSNLEIGFSDKLFDNIILNATAVNQKNHKEWVEKLSIQERIFIVSNKNDFNLKGVHLFTSNGKQLGEKITPPFANNAVYMNFNKTIGFKFPTYNTHTYFIGEMTKRNLNLKIFYNCILNGNNPDFSNKDVYRKLKKKNTFEIVQTK